MNKSPKPPTKKTRRPSRKGVAIASHKGGRSVLMKSWRATPEAAAAIERRMKRDKASYADAMNALSASVVVVGYDGPDDNTYNVEVPGAFMHGFETPLDALEYGLKIFPK